MGICETRSTINRKPAFSLIDGLCKSYNHPNITRSVIVIIMLRRCRPRKSLAVMRGSRMRFGTRVSRIQCFREDFDNCQCLLGSWELIVAIQRSCLLVPASLAPPRYVGVAGIENGLSHSAIE